MSKYQAYPEYKDSGVEWLGEVPNHWDIKKLKFICNVQTGDKDTVNAVDDGSYPFFVRSQTVERINSFGADCEAVLTAGDGVGVGKVFHYYCGKFDYHQRVYMLNNFSSVLGRFVYYYLSNNFYKVALEGNAKSTVDSLRLPQFLNFEFSLPNICEQRNIVNFLDHETAKIDKLIEKQQQLIKLLKEKRQAVISHAVTKGLNPDAPMKDLGVEWLGEVPEHWEVSKVGHCAFVTKLTGFEYTNLWKIEEEGEVIALRGFNVKERKLELNDVERISSELSATLFRSKLARGDIVFPCTGTIGNAAMIEKDDRFHINQNIAKIRFDVTVNPKFANFWLTSSFIRTLIDRNNTSGMQPVVLIGDIRKLPIPRFSYIEQEEIADYLDSVVNRFNVLISSAVSAIYLIQERRTALISAAVTGKIDVRNWEPPYA
ncbi:MAG: restriction endonuclease subunit S [Gammaproteobacteria bacterium]|nr:MAG: restriction endonuclease subunit S [Gammaproteobacteria bacterium]